MEILLFFALIIVIVLYIVKTADNREIKSHIQMISMQLQTLSKRLDKITELAEEIKAKQSTPQVIQTVVQPETIIEDIPKEDIPEEIPIEEKEEVVELIEEPAEEPITEVIQEEIIIQEETPEPVIVIVEEITAIEEPVCEPELEPEPEPVIYAAEKKEIPKLIHPPIREQRKENSLLNQIWGENLLSKIGIVTFVLGIAFFVKYAIDQEWVNEIGRVGIGLLVGAAIIGVGHKLRNQYGVFSSILAGGGFAVFYITITLAFREYQLIPQTAAFALLILVTIACVILSVFYDKKELAIFALLGGFAAPFLVSTDSGNYIVLFSYILILNSGMLFLAFWKKWDVLSIICFVFTQLLVWGWLATGFEDQYLGGALFMLLFFIQFHALAIADHLKKGGKITVFQAIAVLWNNISLFAGWLFIFKTYPAELNGLIAITAAVLNAIPLIIIYRSKRSDQNVLYLLIATVMTFLTLAIPLQAKGYTITLFWSAEMIILMVLWLRSKMQIFSLGVYGVIVLVLISYIIDVSVGYNVFNSADSILPVIANKYFITGVTLILACIAAIYLLKRELGKDPEPTLSEQYSPLYRFFRVITYVLIFIVLYTELYYQLKFRILYPGAGAFRFTMMLTYIITYVAATMYLNRKWVEKNEPGQMLLLGFIAVYGVIFFIPVSELREAVYLEQTIPVSYFVVHLLSLIPVGYLVFQIWGHIRKADSVIRTRFTWILIISIIVIITRESDNIAIMVAGLNANYYNVLYDVHTFGYPILWGLMAMALMVWGLKTKDLVLRKISLVFFAFIIGKFYIYDVWRMSQGGRIVSFVALGLILLVVSFLQQKIRKLVQKEEEKEEIEQ